MKQVIISLYWDAVSDLDKIKRSTLRLSDRLALEKAIVRLEAIKKLLDYYKPD